MNYKLIITSINENHKTSSSSFYLIFNNLDAYTEKTNDNKYLIFASTDKNGMMLGDYAKLWDEIKEDSELISGNKIIRYSGDFMKIKFESDDDLPLGKLINIPVCAIIVKDVFEEDSKYYPQVLLHECFYEYEEYRFSSCVKYQLQCEINSYFFSQTNFITYKFSSCVKC